MALSIHRVDKDEEHPSPREYTDKLHQSIESSVHSTNLSAAADWMTIAAERRRREASLHIRDDQMKRCIFQTKMLCHRTFLVLS